LQNLKITPARSKLLSLVDGFKSSGKFLAYKLDGLTFYGSALKAWALLGLFVLSMAAFSNNAMAQKQGREDSTANPAAASGEEITRLRQRVEQLEEQLIDMQVTVGTVESLARKGGSRGGSSGGIGPQMPMNGGMSGGDGRVQMLETQVGALSRQVEILSQRLGGGSGSSAVSGPRPGDVGPQGGFGNQGFGEVTVTPGAGAQPQSFDQGMGPGGAGGFGAQPANFDNRAPRTIYDEAYKYLMVQNYGAAEAAFKTFISQHPNDGLAGNAQYWLGESYYVRGQYRDAAGAFLKGYKVYAKNQKAPDSLLKLAMSLKRLGQKESACSTFGELGSRFPRAPEHIKERARSERRRSGC